MGKKLQRFLILLLVVVLIVTILYGVCFYNAPIEIQVVQIDDATQKTTVLLSNQPPSIFPSMISILVTGHIDGTGIIHQCFGDGSKDTTYDIGCGEVCLKILGDWYSNECLIKYEPLDVVSGTLKIEYIFSFYNFKSSGCDIGNLQGSVHNLFNATRAGDFDEVKTILEKTPELINAYNTGHSLLHIAALFAHEELVAFLIANGLEADTKTTNDFTALHLAAWHGHKKIVEFLIDKRADVNAKNYIGETPLYLAVSEGHMEVSKFLISKGAEVEVREELFGRTPLHIAARDGYNDVIELLITRGANVNVKDNKGKTPLEIAFDNGYTETVEILRKYIVVE